MTRRVLLLFAVLLTVSIGPRAQEVVTLTTPIAKPTATNCTLDQLLIDVKGKRIVVEVSYSNGDTVSKQYDAFTTPTGASLLTTLNRSNNSVGNTSLVNKVFIRLGLDGICVGTVGGTPQ